MAKNSFLLVNLQDDETKHLAQVITNDSCRRILDHLAEKPATETDIAKLLGLPLSTVHYNIQALVKAGLVEADEFHYSPKGREVNHYKLANKYIIIAPKSTYGIKEKLKSILPIVAVVGVGAYVIQFLARSYTGTGKMMAVGGNQLLASEMTDAAIRTGATATTLAQEAVNYAANTAAPSAQGLTKVAASSAGAVTTTTIQAATTTLQTTTTTLQRYAPVHPSEPNIALWVLIGTISAFSLYLLIDYLVYVKKNKRN